MKLNLLVCSFLVPLLMNAQYGETIRTARPGLAIGAFSLGKNVFQMQTGYNQTFLKEPIGLVDFDSEIFSQNTVLRIGLSEHFEISGVVNWSVQTERIGDRKTSIGGVSGTQIGARYNFTSNKGLLPTLALQYRALLKVKSEAFRSNNIGSRFVLSSGNRLSKDLSLTTNWILTFDGFSAPAVLGYIINISYSISDKWSTFAEVFGSFDPIRSNFDTGLAYLVNKDFQLDVSAGIFDTNTNLEFFYDFGLSWRFDWRK